MQCLEVSCAVRPIYGSLGVKRLIAYLLLALRLRVNGAELLFIPYAFIAWTGAEFTLFRF